MPKKMKAKPAPYEPIPTELAHGSHLIPLKQAANRYQCCFGTLKDNAKARRLRAFQQHFGSPVLVQPAHVEQFLKSRPDIVSVFQPKAAANIHPTVHEDDVVEYSAPPFPFPDEGDVDASTFDPKLGMGVDLRLHSLTHTTPTERALVAKCLSEIARQIMETAPTIAKKSPNTEIHNEH